MDGAQVVSQWQRDDEVIDNQSRQGQQGTMGGKLNQRGRLRPDVLGWCLAGAVGVEREAAGDEAWRSRDRIKII